MQRHVVLIDDLEEDRELYEVGLASLGYRVTLAHISETAKAAEARPDVIVLHLDHDEWNVCDELRRVCGGTPVVVLTAAVRPDQANRERARRTANCAAFVGKPCTHEELGAVLARVLSGERQIEQTSGRTGTDDVRFG